MAGTLLIAMSSTSTTSSSYVHQAMCYADVATLKSQDLSYILGELLNSKVLCVFHILAGPGSHVFHLRKGEEVLFLQNWHGKHM